jgi:hypothetical protein
LTRNPLLSTLGKRSRKEVALRPQQTGAWGGTDVGGDDAARSSSAS